MRPSMLLAAYSVAEAKALIDRGLASMGTNPTGKAHVLYSSDGIRNVRARVFPLTNLGFALSPSINLSVDGSAALPVNSLLNTSDTLFYFNGVTRVANLGTNSFLPGAVGDHLTSSGGALPDGFGQMTVLDWIAAGETGSFGSVDEPCAVTTKFPDPSIMIPHYTSGETLIEAYWKSMPQTFQGLFVGDPLAKPWARTATVSVPTIYSFSAAPSTIVSGGSTNLFWNVSNATSISINQSVGAVTGQSKSISPTAPTSYTLSATNSAGTVISAPITVNVTSVPTAPIISGILNTCPNCNRVASIVWNTDSLSDSQLDYGTTTSYGQSSALSPALVVSHTILLTTLTSGTVYHYRVKSRTAFGNISTSADNVLTTGGGTAGPDVTPPSIPANLSAAVVSSSQVNLSWAASTDNIGVVGYYVFRGGVQIGSSTSNTYIATGLIPSTTYNFTVSAYDAAGNISSLSSPALVVTSPVVDTLAPSTPNGFTSSN